MNDPARDRRRVLGGLLLAAAGAYVLFQPFGMSPGTCALGGVVGDIGQAITMCVASVAPLFVIGSLVGLVSILAALWMLLPGAGESRIGSFLLGAAVLAIVAAGIYALATSPSSPLRTFPPAQTAAPVQTAPAQSAVPTASRP